MKVRNPQHRHLTPQLQWQHAESLADAGKTVDAGLAAHVAQCAQCASGVESIRASLGVLHAVPELETTESMTAAILLRAREERHLVGLTARHSAGRARWSRIADAMPHMPGWHARRLFATAVCMLGVASAGLFYQRQEPPALVATRPVASVTMPLPETLKKTAAEVHTLSAVLRAPAHQAEDPHLMARRRAVQAMDADIAAALSALERNPGCERAGKVVQANLERQAQTLREMYASKGL